MIRMAQETTEGVVVSYPQIAIGQIPDQPEQRRALRTLAFDLRLRLRIPTDPQPVVALINTPVQGAGVIDLIIARSNTLIVAALLASDGPIVAEAGREWYDANNQRLDRAGQHPLHYIGMQRDTLRARLNDVLPTTAPLARGMTRTIAALVVTPHMHPESRIALDFEDHRAFRKVLGLDELTGLMVMSSIGAYIPEQNLYDLIDLVGSQIWHDGNRLLFELAPPPFRLRLLGEGTHPRPVLPLIEGENIIGRRRIAKPHEHRLTISGDDLISSDHAMLIALPDQRLIIRDVSKNGTWLTPPGGEESFLHNAERPLIPGSILRMGETLMRVEEG
ncbi:MAG: hypothetical protein Fur005_38540 [Roseiflexaceae bacterium]